MNLSTPVINIKGIGEKTNELFAKIGIITANDLLHYYPRNYDKYEEISNFSKVTLGDKGAFKATVISIPKIQKFNGKSIVSFYINDGENSVEVKFFNAPYMAKAFKPKAEKIFRGILRAKGMKVFLDQPKVYDVSEYESLQGSIVPIYPLIKDLGNEKIKKSVLKVISELPSDLNKEYLSISELNELKLLDYNSALKEIHFPQNEVNQFLARRRLIFEEFLEFIDCTKNEENKTDLLMNSYPMIPVADCKRLEESLPYKLTNAQKRVVDEILSDMQGDYLMNRVVQGDVGSGKTIVAIMALLQAVSNGYQASMMAPTEVLAKQHFQLILELTKKYNLAFKPVYIAGKMTAKEKREALKAIESGEVNCIIGTHAIFQDKVVFNNLALVITDEQHRFGVKQRELFKDKGIEPHILVMSATPIPRTLAMVIFGGKTISVIDELPKNRIPISNCVVNSNFRVKAYEKIRSEINKGHQAYVICPMVSDNEENELDLKSVETHAKDLKEYFGDDIRISTLNGKMKSNEKTRIMEDFKDNKADILVSTTVIEVGIDVPNATIIMIENAERFGLSTLHQLRGRVGRGQFESYCILMSDSKNDETKKRLAILNDTNDGFKIANEDLKLRGPGELNGVRQSGELSFGLGDIVNDSDLMIKAIEKYEVLKKRGLNFNGNLIDFRTI